MVNAAPATITTLPVEDSPDLLAVLPLEGALCWLRHGEGLVGWGEAARLEVSGPAALAEVADWWASYTSDAVIDDQVVTPGSGPVLFASIAFDPVAGTSVFVVPEVVVGRRRGVSWCTGINGAYLHSAPTAGDADKSSVPVLRYSDGALDPASWCTAVAAALKRIDTGELTKVVLARELIVAADEPLSHQRVLRRLAARFPLCWTFAVDGLLGATPELLLRRTGRRLWARVLAGTSRRGAGNEDIGLGASLLASEKNRAEHDLALESLVRALQPYCRTITTPGRPELLTLPNVLHLASDVHGIQRCSGSAREAGLLELVGSVHPTAAVCGTPAGTARTLIKELEAMDRGRYAGPVGWLDSRGDGEFGLALRCAEFGRDGFSARLFAGCGIVAGSDPLEELIESQAKFSAVQAALEC
ncbi:menaquinone-specific isochorismate synthase [Geodermatophilus bullaregiensis]|uniref:isochorismate synthase n=1 Tax=Geodermatophilus bullaregiensis TaxID=1564160 RepID=UPI0027DE251D|nr:isochorismate synthase [Geodermatophilus bullaregiensis]MBM7808066.1 menaquinone-specific isochorismate synthase [Geodermatophilus bullaregiensis]